MRRCDRLSTILACLALLAPAAAFAEDEKGDPETGFTTPIITSNCDLTNFKSGVQSFAPATAIPDNTPAGITLGPIVLAADGMYVDNVVLELDMNHPWLGDLIVRLSYDENSDGAMDVTCAVICRPGGTSCATSGLAGTCGSNLTTGAIYRFDDTAAGTLPTSSCLNATNIPGGCYQTTGVGSNPLSAFHGRTKGGRWWLFVSDNQGSDVGNLTSWTVHILNTSVAVVPTSWGQLKLHYR